MSSPSQDTTRTNPARIYDYMLDGTHNFPVDREIGEKNKRNRPGLVKFVRLNRDFLTLAGRQFAEASYPAYIDLATGLPTEGALHELVPETARVLYNDHDPVVISYAGEILEEYAEATGRSTANIRYVQSPIEQIERILAAAEQFFGPERRVGICLIGVAYFIADADLQRVCQQWHRWAAPGSALAVTSFDTEQDASWQDLIDEYRKMGVHAYPRPAERLAELLHPWLGSFTPLETIIEAELGTQVAEPHERGRLGYAGIFRHD